MITRREMLTCRTSLGLVCESEDRLGYFERARELFFRFGERTGSANVVKRGSGCGTRGFACVLVAPTGLASFASSSERVTSRRDTALSIPELTGCLGNISSTIGEQRGGVTGDEPFKIEDNVLQDVATGGESIVGSSG